MTARRGLLGAVALAALVSVSASDAWAQPRPAGGVTGHAVVGTAGRIDEPGTDGVWGGGVTADVTAPFGALRLGGALGVTALTSNVDDASRVLMPVALSLGVVIRSSPFWVELRGRGGIWAGATNQGLAVGAFFSAGALLAFDVGPNVAVGASAEAFFMLAHGDVFAFVPGITLVWAPAEEDDRGE